MARAVAIRLRRPQGDRTNAIMSCSAPKVAINRRPKWPLAPAINNFIARPPGTTSNEGARYPPAGLCQVDAHARPNSTSPRLGLCGALRPRDRRDLQSLPGQSAFDRCNGTRLYPDNSCSQYRVAPLDASSSPSQSVDSAAASRAGTAPHPQTNRQSVMGADTKTPTKRAPGRRSKGPIPINSAAMTTMPSPRPIGDRRRFLLLTLNP